MLDSVGPGTRIGGRYVVRRAVEDDGTTGLWQADDETLGRSVALRWLAPDHPAAAQVVDAARRAAAVEDPRLVRVLDVGDEDGSSYVVSEWVDLPRLEDVLADEGALAPETARHLVGELSLALDRAARRGLHHLRLGPRSVLLDRAGTVKVDGLAVDAALAGVDEPDGARASADDAAGLVAVLYAALTAHWPGTDASLSDLPAPPRVDGHPTAPVDLVPDVPADLDTLCVQTVVGDKAPSAVGELAFELAPWTAPSGPPPGIPVTPAEASRHASPAAGVPVGSAGTSEDPTTDAVDDPDESTRPMPAVAPGAPAQGGPGAPRPLTPVDDRTDRPTRPEEPHPDESGRGRPKRPTRGPRRPRAQEVAGGSAVFFPDRDEDSGGHGTVTDTAEHPVVGLGGPGGPRRASSGPSGSRAGGSGAGGSGDDVSPDAEGAAGPRGGWSTSPLRSGREQSRGVIAAVVAFIAVMCLLAYCGLRGLGDSGPTASRDQRTPAATSSGGSQQPGTPTPSASAPPKSNGAVIKVVEASGLDPDGDGQEKDSQAKEAVDGRTGTSWTSDRYNSADWGGLKDGVGLLLDLGEARRVSQAQVTVGGSGSTVQLLSVRGDSLEGSDVLAEVEDASGTVTLRADQPVTTRYVAVWFTRPVQVDGGYRVEVKEVVLR